MINRVLRISVSSSLALATTLPATMSVAQPASVQPAIAAGRGGQFFSGGGGTFTYYEKSRLESEILGVLRERSTTDYEFVQRTVQQINANLEAFRRNHLVAATPPAYNVATVMNRYVEGGGRQLNVLNDQGEPNPELQRVLGATQKFKADLADLDNLIHSVSAIPTAVNKPNEVKINGEKVSIAAYGATIDFGPLVKHYEDQLTALKSELANAQIMVRQNNNATVMQPLLNIKLGNTYTQNQLVQMNKDMQRALAIDFDLRNSMRSVHQFTVNTFSRITTTFGSDQQYRLNMNDAQRSEVIADFQKLMWKRSLLRANTGIPGLIGAIGVNYKKKSFNRDVLTAGVDLEILSEPITDQNELAKVRDAIVYKMFQLETRTQDATALATYEKTFNSLTNAVSTINSLRTFFEAKIQLADVSKIVLKELAYDAQEEYLLATGKFSEMRRVYQARWYTGKTDDEIKQIRAEAAVAMGTSTQVSSGPQALNGQIGTANMTSIWNLAYSQMRLYASKYERGMQIKAALDAAEGADGSNQRINQNNSDL